MMITLLPSLIIDNEIWRKTVLNIKNEYSQISDQMLIKRNALKLNWGTGIKEKNEKNQTSDTNHSSMKLFDSFQSFWLAF